MRNQIIYNIVCTLFCEFYEIYNYINNMTYKKINLITKFIHLYLFIELELNSVAYRLEVLELDRNVDFIFTGYS
jgi:hypothetical protein